MKRSITACFFLILFHTSFAQLSLGVFNYRPTGDFGFVFKPTFSAELGYISSFDDGERFRTRLTATFIILRQRLETIPTAGVLKDNGIRILPGELSFQKYNLGLVFGGFDYAIIHKSPFYFYAGMDIVVGGTAVEYTNNIETLITEIYSGGGFLLGVRFRLGSEYKVSEKISLLVHAQRAGWIVTDPKSLNASNDYGIGLKYNFE